MANYSYCFYYSLGKLYFLSDDYSDRYRSNSSYVPFINDPALVYTAFFADFGPLDLGLTYKFCQQFHDALQHANEQHKALIYYAGSHPHKRANSAVLLQAYLVNIQILLLLIDQLIHLFYFNRFLF